MSEKFVTDHMIIPIQTLQSAPHMSAPALQRTVDQTSALFSVWEQRVPSLLTCSPPRSTWRTCVSRTLEGRGAETTEHSS